VSALRASKYNNPSENVGIYAKSAKTMNGDSNAKDEGCEAVYIPSEDGIAPGKWHFKQEYDKGTMIIKRQLSLIT
jgi:hypothetical protein